MKIKIIILALSIMVIMLCVIFLTPPLINMRERSIKSSEALDRISAHLDVDANWDVVRNKIYCDILREGETLGRIESSLNEITSVTMFKEDDLWYTIYFTEPYVNIDDVGLTFDKNNHLIGKFRRVGIGNVTAINCP